MPPVYRFDDIQVDPLNFRVLKSGKAVSVEPKSLHVLIFMIEHRGRMIEKQELIDAVWSEAFVSENVLTRAVAQLRKALGDDPKEARYIETVPTRGYRFIARVDVQENGEGSRNDLPAPESGPATAGKPSLPTAVATGAQSPKRKIIAAVLLLSLLVIAALTIAVVRVAHPPRQLEVLRETQLTTSDALTMDPTFSPDATSMAYSADRGSGFEIFVRQLGAGGREVQITTDSGQNMQPAWSPDGKFIAYYSHSRNGIWLVPALGGVSRKLIDFGSRPSWARDGQWIAFQSAPLNDFNALSSEVFPPSTIWVVHADGTDAHQITRTGKPEGGHGSPSWSPDGTHVAFITAEYGSSALWATALDGSGTVQLSARGRLFSPVYTPDGNSIIYGAVAAGSVYGLWQLRISPSTSAPVGEPVQLTNSGATVYKNLSFSRDGKKRLYTAEESINSLRSLFISPVGKGVGETRELTRAVGCRTVLPSFSHDGSRITFGACIGRPGVASQIWIMNSDGSNLQQLTSGDRAGNEPNWFPDGEHLLFESQRSNKKTAFFSIDVNTRQEKSISQLDQDVGKFSLSPDGTQIAFSPSVEGAVNIWTMIVATHGIKQLTFDKEMLGFPAWSPDGKLLAAELQRGQDSNIEVLSANGGNQVQLTFGHGNHWPNSWSPDGDRILYARQEAGGVWNIWSVSRSTKREQQLTDNEKLNAFVRYPVMSPRNQLVYEYTETTGNIWMLEFK